MFLYYVWQLVHARVCDCAHMKALVRDAAAVYVSECAVWLQEGEEGEAHVYAGGLYD